MPSGVSPRCRYRNRMEDAKFATPTIPKSGVVGVTFSRLRKRWEVRIPQDGRLKYIGSFGSSEQALDFRAAVVGP